MLSFIISTCTHNIDRISQTQWSKENAYRIKSNILYFIKALLQIHSPLIQVLFFRLIHPYNYIDLLAHRVESVAVEL